MNTGPINRILQKIQDIPSIPLSSILSQQQILLRIQILPIVCIANYIYMPRVFSVVMCKHHGVFNSDNVTILKVAVAIAAVRCD